MADWWSCSQVSLLKCFVGNMELDISANQSGGVSAACFFEEVDRLVGKDHLFKRSCLLIKVALRLSSPSRSYPAQAWCYYSARILCSHHGNISTYALQVLVAYVFNVFHSTLKTPVQVC